MRYWQRKRERLRSLFNAKYFRLKQLAIRTNYRYNMRNYIITPPITQCTHQYDTMLRRLCRLDGLSPQELQEKRMFIHHHDRRSRRGETADRSRQKPSHVNNDSLQKLWKSLMETELVLPDPTLRPDEIGIPNHVMESLFESADMNKVAAVVKRDPVFSSDAITTFTRVIAMYCYFYAIDVQPDQRISNRGISSSLARKVHGVGRDRRGRGVLGSNFHPLQLNETLLSLAQQNGPFVAYGFLMNVRSLSFTGYNAGRIYPIGPDPRPMALHIAESGSKGTKEAVERVFAMTATKESDDDLIMRVNNTVYDLGHLINYMQREWIMSDLTARTILEGVHENKAALRLSAVQREYGSHSNGDRKTIDGYYNRWDDAIEKVLYG
ncbi:hypothetical protein J6590_070735 [Homalodisca vitripennis]|nr:hypothetical protein J6590_070735 [Homalodisca vitripennis]